MEPAKRARIINFARRAALPGPLDIDEALPAMAVKLVGGGGRRVGPTARPAGMWSSWASRL